MDGLRVSALGTYEDSRLIADIGETECAIEINYGGSITTIPVDYRKLIEWCEIVSDLDSSYGGRASD